MANPVINDVFAQCHAGNYTTFRVGQSSPDYTLGVEVSTPGRDTIFLMDEYKMLSGARIKEARERLKLSQSQLADKIGVEASAVGNYEQGSRYPKPPVLRKLAEVLHTPIGWISGLEPDKRIEALSLLYSKLDSRGRDTVFRLAESQSSEFPDDNKNAK